MNYAVMSCVYFYFFNLCFIGKSFEINKRETWSRGTVQHSSIQYNTLILLVLIVESVCRHFTWLLLYLTSPLVQAVLQLSFYTIYTLNFRDFFFECWNFFILLYIAALWPWGKSHLCRFSLSVDNRKALSRAQLCSMFCRGGFSPLAWFLCCGLNKAKDSHLNCQLPLCTQVSTRSRQNKKTQSLLSCNRKAQCLPDNVPAVHLQFTEYYFPDNPTVSGIIWLDEVCFLHCTREFRYLLTCLWCYHLIDENFTSSATSVILHFH